MLIQVLLATAVRAREPDLGKRGSRTGLPLTDASASIRRKLSISFVGYLSAAAIAFVAATVAVDPTTCQWVLFALGVATTLIPFMIPITSLGG